MALYLVAMPSLGERTAEIMLAAAKRLVAAIREEKDSLPLGVGMNIGVAQVGALAMGESKGFTAIGDVVNTAARLQSKAEAYEIVISDAVYAALAKHLPEAKRTTFELKGKAEPQTVHVIPAAN
jgi:adenylate cyclase